MKSREIQAIALMGWVTIAKKQIYQIAGLVSSGYAVTILTNDRYGDSEESISEASPDVTTIILKNGVFSRIIQILEFLNKAPRSTICIIAPVGRFSIVYLILAKFFRKKTICVEWGDIGEIKRLPVIIRFNMMACYKCSDIVWYKEPYMKELLEQYSPKKTFFLHNAVDANHDLNLNFCDRDISFIWANRLCNRRHPDWYSGAFAICESKFSDINGVLLGFLDNSLCDRITMEMQAKIKSNCSNKLDLINFSDPYPYFKRSRFFVLAADVVFGNNALLEAMSHGIVPIVTASPGVELIIEDGISGIIAEPNDSGLLVGMSRALELTKEQWSLMSANAIKVVDSDFRPDAWVNNMRRLIDELNGHPN